MQIPNCDCPKIENLSPLHQIRWKRLVVDEGHNSATYTTNFIHFSKLLSVERRWIVTGTPTSNLLGLSFGQETDDGHGLPPLNELTDDEECNNNVSRIWTKYDREDLRKLANMMAHFLVVPRFSAEQSAFSVQVTEPLLSRAGPLPGAIQVLTQVMSSVMVRHR